MWFVLSLASVLLLATAELLQQRLLGKVHAFTERTSAVLTFFFESLLTLPILLFSPYAKDFFMVFAPSVFPKLLAVTSLSSIAMIFYLRSFKVKNISFSSIFGSVSILVATTLGIIVFNESVHPMKFVGILLVLSAIVLLNYRNVHLEKNHFFSLLSGIIFGVCYTLDKSILLSVNTLVYMFWTFLFASFFGFLFQPKNVIESVRGKKPAAYKLIVVSGVCYFLYNICTFSAYRFGGEVGKVDAINNTAVFFFILFEYFVLSHKIAIKRKIIAAFIAYLGIAILGFF